MNILKVVTDKRRKGNVGEDAAAKFLRKNGYKILERNFVGDGSEIDLIAKNRKDGTTVFVEVKTRSVDKTGSYESRPAAAVTPEKQRKIIFASKIYMSRMRLKTKMRYDVIEVLLENIDGKEKIADIRHLISAYDYNTAYDAKYFYSKRKDY